ncbi:fused (3R)-hydroxyacyl-ACP dehydratase subunits HadA/HadB [Nocardia sp. NBC_00565]|uniref:fused (3R)-hydroxyacyl-ACP dehydratase subunits HadA/HadB n=1 Tax=Nocardia sp. NBC_00565 TaxID=2975993 RepID=UPI002E8231E2|nr:fused (3R)-hydroxyacyl-ACP dehydratase subunits HadA/HadB [Nocardia sp. NBC_00565]WUC02449.1 fused (3R)-hydroxyacyl-ACP dehydratase subunits HadA/HadB [Nocardia sp. NBC_00565]
MVREQTIAQPETEVVVQQATLAGRRFRIRDHYAVGREKVREFARATQSRHGAHHFEPDARKLGYDGIVAPPTFASVIGISATRALLDSVLSHYDMSQILQTDQVFELTRPIVAGDRLTTEIAIESIRQFGDNDFILVTFSLINQHGEIVQSGSTTIVARRGVEIDPSITDTVENIMMHTRPVTVGDIADPAGGPLVALAADGPPGGRPAASNEIVHTLPDFDRLSAGEPIPAATAQVTRGDLANYAGVSGDHNPIHFSDRAAELAGLPSVVAHGMLTMSLAGGYLTSWLGDPTAIEKFSVRFSGFVPVTPEAPSTVEFSGKIKSLNPHRRSATVVLAGSSQGRKLFGRAIAEVRFA